MQRLPKLSMPKNFQGSLFKFRNSDAVTLGWAWVVLTSLGAIVEPAWGRANLRVGDLRWQVVLRKERGPGAN